MLDENIIELLKLAYETSKDKYDENGIPEAYYALNAFSNQFISTFRAEVERAIETTKIPRNKILGLGISPSALLYIDYYIPSALIFPHCSSPDIASLILSAASLLACFYSFSARLQSVRTLLR